MASGRLTLSAEASDEQQQQRDEEHRVVRCVRGAKNDEDQRAGDQDGGDVEACGERKFLHRWTLGAGGSRLPAMIAMNASASIFTLRGSRRAGAGRGSGSSSYSTIFR